MKIWLHAVRVYISIGLFFYFKKIETKNRFNIPLNEPVMLLSNHQNALLDALIIATKSKRFVYFLTRASVFEKPLIAKILTSLNMIPVYRVRDGWGSISKNNAIFNSCSKLLNQGEAVALFPEGNHNLKRTVRLLSKGFTRIVDDTLATYPETKLKLMPIGLNYNKPTHYPDSVMLNYGELIEAQDFIVEGLLDSGELRIQMQQEISKLTTNIPSENYDAHLSKLTKLKANFLEPVNVNSCIVGDFKNCKFHSPKESKYLKPFFKGLLICCLLLPYGIWKLWVRPKVKELEFVDTFRFTIAITLVPIYLIISTWVILFSFNVKIGLLYLLSILIIAFCSAKC